MSGRSIVVEHNGVKYSGHIASIKSTRLGYEDHGILTASLEFSWDGSGVSFGGYCLDEPKDRKGKDYTRRGTAYGLDYLIRVLETVGVEKWESLVGKQAIVLFDFTPSGSTLGLIVRGVAGLLTDKVFIPQEHAAEWIAQSEVSA